MDNFNITFSMTSNGQTQTYKATELKKSKEMYRISFPSADDSKNSYSITIVNKSKIVFACSGMISYNFTLERGKTSRFIINMLNSPVECEVFCENLSVTLFGDKINLSGKYKLDVGGNVNIYRFTLGGNLC